MSSIVSHVSFDVWNTLITANPQFAKSRNQFIARCVNEPVDVVKTAYTATKKFVDGIAETDGIGLSSPAVYDDLFKRLGVTVSPSIKEYIMRRVQYLFLAYPPSILNEVKEAICILDQAGISWSISSNSNFISGTTMFPFIQQELHSNALCGQFSDLMETAKPNRDFFEQVYSAVKSHHGNIEPENILHVGDNPICDGDGPKKLGMQYAIIEGPHELFNAVMSNIQHP